MVHKYLIDFLIHVLPVNLIVHGEELSFRHSDSFLEAEVAEVFEHLRLKVV